VYLLKNLTRRDWFGFSNIFVITREARLALMNRVMSISLLISSNALVWIRFCLIYLRIHAVFLQQHHQLAVWAMSD
jgi:hypothetical protein